MSSTLERDANGVYTLHLGDGDIRFNADTVAALNEHLATIETEVAAEIADGGSGRAALVTTASGKIWHNGLDLEWMGGIDDVWAFVGTVEQLFARLMRLPVPTVAAIGGHAFAGGAMFALAHDQRAMRGDRGFFCLPEIDLGMTFGTRFAALVAAKAPTAAITRLAVLGERLKGPDAVELGVIDVTASADEVTDTATKMARSLTAKAGPAIAGIRNEFFGAAIDALATGRS